MILIRQADEFIQGLYGRGKVSNHGTTTLNYEVFNLKIDTDRRRLAASASVGSNTHNWESPCRSKPNLRGRTAINVWTVKHRQHTFSLGEQVHIVRTMHKRLKFNRTSVRPRVENFEPRVGKLWEQVFPVKAPRRLGEAQRACHVNPGPLQLCSPVLWFVLPRFMAAEYVQHVTLLVESDASGAYLVFR